MPATRGLIRWFWRSQVFNTPTQVDDVCVYVVRDPASRPTPVERWPKKTETGNYLYVIDWSIYAATDPIITSTWEVDKGLNIWSESFTDIKTNIFVGFGRDHRTYALKNTVMLTSTTVFEQVVKLIVDNQICIIVPPPGPGGAELACL